MTTTPSLYDETTISGTMYKRAHRVEIVNQLNTIPSISIYEQSVIVLDSGNIFKHSDTLYTALDVNNQLHIDIYTKINELYVLLRTERDNKLAETIIPVVNS